MTDIISILMLLTAMFLIWKLVKTITITVNVNVKATLPKVEVHNDAPEIKFELPEIKVKMEPAPIQMIETPKDEFYDKDGKPLMGPEKTDGTMAALNSIFHGIEEVMNE